MATRAWPRHPALGGRRLSCELSRIDRSAAASLAPEWFCSWLTRRLHSLRFYLSDGFGFWIILLPPSDSRSRTTALGLSPR